MFRLNLAPLYKKKMKTLIQNFTKQLQEALEIGNSTILKPNNRSFHNVLITGMGGSGIGGTIISELATDCNVPIIINKTYDLPSVSYTHLTLPTTPYV